MKNKQIKVLIVDDSAVARTMLTEILSSDPKIKVIGTAADPYIAARKMSEKAPDVVILDVELPRMDGVTFLHKIMTQHPLPVVMCSALTEKGCETTLKVLEYGAVDVIQKPKVGVKDFFEASRIMICDTVKAAAGANLKPLGMLSGRPEPKLSADVMLRKAVPASVMETSDKVICVGASTGGVVALQVFLESIPVDCHGIVIVQHMPEQFTRVFAERLNKTCRIAVKEAANGDTVRRGRALIAPGNRHTLLKRNGAHYFVEVQDGPLVCRHQPSVDVLFRSGARYADKNAVGIILTGMGDDGAQGLVELKNSGALTIAQNEASCVVFGMPKEAIDRGGAVNVLPLEQIAGEVFKISTQ